MGVLERQLRQRAALLPDASLQLRLQGHDQGLLPQVLAQDGFRQVLRRERRQRRPRGRRFADDRLPARLRADAPGQRRRLGQGPVQRPHRLPLEDGLGVSVVGIVPFRGTYFGVNDTLVSINPYQKDKGLVGIASKFACAQTAALCAAYASYPFDTVRRRLQMQSEKPQEEWVYKGTMDCFGKIAAEEGVGALFKGAGANALRTVGSALVLVMYGELKGILAGAAGK